MFGTRPEAIKMAPIVRELANRKQDFSYEVCVTAQHRQMLDQVLEIFKITPKYDLNLMKESQSLASITSEVLMGVSEVLTLSKPDLVLVHGDTTTTFAATLASFYQRISVGHVEAGLRTFDLAQPFPEELNRQFVGKVAEFHFAPTVSTQENLIREGVERNKVFVTGNTVIDSLKFIIDYIDSDLSIRSKIKQSLASQISFDVEQHRFILITGHRRENFGDGFNQICVAIRTLAESHPEIKFIYPVHLNPNVLNPVNTLLGNLDNVYLIKPQDYLNFVFLLKNCYLVLTDSGGIQEEAPTLGKPVLVMRNKTERHEAVSAGTSVLVGTSTDTIISNVNKLIDDSNTYNKVSEIANPFGSGKSAIEILDLIKKNL